MIDYPASICPLTKRRSDDPAVAERFELFVQGMEIANAYTELNDPDLQQKLFETQLAGLPEEESMARWTRISSGRCDTACRRPAAWAWALTAS